MPEQTNYLAFTIDQLDEMLDVMESNDGQSTPSEFWVSLGLLLKFGKQGSALPSLPTSITQLTMSVTSTDDPDEVTLHFEEIGALASIPSSGETILPPTEQIGYQSYTVKPASDEPYLNTIKSIDDTGSPLALQFANQATKAVFFSRTQLLLFKRLLVASRGEHELLFSGWNHHTGKMGAIVNMAELKRFNNGDGLHDASNWFGLKAEFWKKSETSYDSVEKVKREAERITQASISDSTSRQIPGVTRLGLSPASEGEEERVSVPSITFSGNSKVPMVAIGRPCPPYWMTTAQITQEISHYFERTEGLSDGDNMAIIIDTVAEVSTDIGNSKRVPNFPGSDILHDTIVSRSVNLRLDNSNGTNHGKG